MNKMWKVLANKYFLVGLCFVLWVAFFDQNDWLTMRQRGKELQSVNDNIAYLQKEIKRMEAERKSLVTNQKGELNDPATLEKYAREQYRMSHDNEDVYVIDKE